MPNLLSRIRNFQPYVSVLRWHGTHNVRPLSTSKRNSLCVHHGLMWSAFKGPWRVPHIWQVWLSLANTASRHSLYSMDWRAMALAAVTPPRHKCDFAPRGMFGDWRRRNFCSGVSEYRVPVFTCLTISAVNLRALGIPPCRITCSRAFCFLSSLNSGRWPTSFAAHGPHLPPHALSESLRLLKTTPQSLQATETYTRKLVTAPKFYSNYYGACVNATAPLCSGFILLDRGIV